jgi:hypothetical protein
LSVGISADYRITIMDQTLAESPIAAAAAASAAPGAKLAFLHIPKTAGTSFTRALARGWPRVRIVATPTQFDAIPEADAAQLDLVAGHFLAHQLAAPRWQGFAALTVLRDPRARLLSSYRYARAEGLRKGDDAPPAMRFAARVSFAEYAFSVHGVGDRHGQILMLARDGRANPHDLPLRDLLERAKAVLERIEVGTTERLDEFLAYLYRRFDRGEPPALPRLNTAEERNDDDAEVLHLTRAQDEALRELMRPDEELVEYGRRLFEMRAEKLARGG